LAAETALELTRKAAAHMADRGIENARLEAELMLGSILGLNRLQLYMQFDRPIDGAQLEQFRSMVRRRLKREPLQYILGEAHFRTLRLHVDPRVLIPRPETELLVEQVLEFLRLEQRAGPVLDLGTGSGAIAISVAMESAVEQIVATDLSADALAVARDNAQRAGVVERIEFRRGSLWQAVRAAERFDVIVSNPPYIAERERDELQPEVRDWEPGQALFSGADGLNAVREIVAGAAARLNAGGLLAIEIGADQGAAVLELLECGPGLAEYRIEKDLAGRDRIALARATLGVDYGNVV